MQSKDCNAGQVQKRIKAFITSTPTVPALLIN